MNLDDLIEFEEEHTCLDFKSKEYNKDNWTDLIKDVMSMANSLDSNTKRIIIGVKQKPGEEKEFLGVEEISDQATLENIIQENIEPTINFRYFKHYFKGVNLGIIEIIDNNDRPYMMKKDYGKCLKRGDAWIRKGSRQSRMGRPELDEILDARRNIAFNNKISMGFGKNLKKEISISKNIEKLNNLPSKLQKEYLEELVSKLNERYGLTGDKEKGNDGLQSLKAQPNVLGIFREFRDYDKSIITGYSQIGHMPIYKNKEKLLEDIANVEDNYYDDDCYYIYEEISKKFNCYIYNDSTQFLEDVIIKMYFDSDIFLVADKIYDKPRSANSIQVYMKMPNYNYPSVFDDGKFIIAESNLNEIRHKTLTNVFIEDLRILVKPEVSLKETEIKYRISAKNLPDIVEGAIKVLIL